MALLSKENFFQKYNIDSEEFEKSGLNWGTLASIFNDYLEYKKTLTLSANAIAEALRSHPDVHTVRTRIKNPEHLIEKIIRKSIKNMKMDEKDNEINIESYKSEITDLIGIRVLHLYKEQAANIDKLIRVTWELLEKPTIYYRKGDHISSELRDNNQFQIKEHPAGYRSWHYLVSTSPTLEKHIAEIQVRTIFEEGWSEIDHQLRYPYDLNNPLLSDQLLVLNRLAGSADEMINTIRETKLRINKLVAQNIESEKMISELKDELQEALEKAEINSDLKKSLEEKVKKLEDNQRASFRIETNSPVEFTGNQYVDMNIDFNNYLSAKNTSNYRVLSGTYNLETDRIGIDPQCEDDPSVLNIQGEVLKIDKS